MTPKLIIVAYINLSYKCIPNRTRLYETFLGISERFHYQLGEMIPNLEAKFIPVININNSLTEIDTKLEIINTSKLDDTTKVVIDKLESIVKDIQTTVELKLERIEGSSFRNKLRMCWTILKSKGHGFLMLGDEPITKSEAINTINNSNLI